jgi:hypothetical protein
MPPGLPSTTTSRSTRHATSCARRCRWVARTGSAGSTPSASRSHTPAGNGSATVPAVPTDLVRSGTRGSHSGRGKRCAYRRVGAPGAHLIQPCSFVDGMNSTPPAAASTGPSATSTVRSSRSASHRPTVWAPSRGGLPITSRIPSWYGSSRSATGAQSDSSDPAGRSTTTRRCSGSGARPAAKTAACRSRCPAGDTSSALPVR